MMKGVVIRAIPRLLVLLVLATSYVPAVDAADVPKSLVIMLDGTRSDGIINAITPNIDSLIDGTFGGGAYQGSFAYAAQTIQDAPTSSAYNHVSIMTGVSAAKHGAASNSAAGIAAVDYNSWPTYLSTLEADDPNLNTAFLATWTADLSMVTGADYDKDSDDAGNVARTVDIIEGTHSDPSGDNGTSWSFGTDVDAIALFLDDNDAAGHGNGFDPGVPAYLIEIESIDVQIGQILTAIENRPNFANEDWLIVITTDHGGIGTSHGGLNPNSETIPLLVASKSTSQGILAGRALNQDAAATALAHMLGPGAVPGHYDAVPQGTTVIAPPPAELTDSLVLYLPFNGDFLDASGLANDASVGAGSDIDPTALANGGKFAGYLQIIDFGGGAADASYLTLGNPPELEFGAATDFTIATWFRAPADQSGDPVILGNKDWVSGLNTGTLMLANENNGDDFGFNVSDGTLRRDVEAIDYTLNDWWFQAASVDRDGNVVMFVGSPTGLLWVISDFADDLGDINSGWPWNIGQDGTGAYPHNLDGDIDELAVWQRSLLLDEIQVLYNAGSGINLLNLIGQTPAAPSGLAAATYSSSEIRLSWVDNSNDEDGFRVERSPTGTGSWTHVFTTGANVTGWSDSGRSTGTTYFYRVLAHNPIGNSAPSNTDSATTFTVPRTLQFSGRSWTVKASAGPVGPGPNYFGDTADDVWVDGSGHLHLRIQFRDGNWHSSEVITDDVLGFGTYTFTLGSRVDQLDRNIVVGLFTWDSSAPEFNFREIDIEFARWGDPLNDNSQYVVQPWNNPGNTLRWDTVLTGDDSTHSFAWHPDRVEFSSFQGDPPGATIQSWTYNGTDVPPEGSTSGNARINFWLTGGSAPFDGQEAELVIKAFDFTPLASTDVVANADIFGSGSVSGSFVTTHSDDGNAQSITERESGGKKRNRYSFLVHTWSFNVPANGAATVNANAWSGGSVDDNFRFSWSTDNSNYSELFVVSSTDSANLQSAALPAGTSGTVYIRVEDSNQTPGNRTLDTVFVDHLFISTDAAAGDPPTAPTALTATAAGSSQVDVVWTDNADNEVGFRIERSLNGVAFTPTGTASANDITFSDTGLAAGTTYWYRVLAWNASGDSAWSNTDSATTDPGSGIPLSLSGYKDKGRHVVDLTWSGINGASVDIFRDGVLEYTVPNTGGFTDSTGNRGGRSYDYQVCEVGGGTCSDVASIAF